MGAVGKGNTKLILFGEHAAVYGYPAIGLPLPWTVKVSLKPANATQWNTKGLDPHHKIKLDALLDQIPDIFPEMAAMPPVEIMVETDAPIGVGFGSSGALCVALTRSIIAYLERDARNQSKIECLLTTWKYAHQLEKNFHHTPSGIDTGLSTLKTACYFMGKNGELPQHHSLNEIKLPIVIGALPRSSNTANLISNLRIMKEHDSTFGSRIEGLGEVAAEAIQKMIHPQSNTANEVGALASKAHKELKELGLSTPFLDTLIDYGLSLGATGGKLSGAGGGGAYFLIAQDTSQASEIALKLKSFSIKEGILHTFPPTAIS